MRMSFRLGSLFAFWAGLVPILVAVDGLVVPHSNRLELIDELSSIFDEDPAPDVIASVSNIENPFKAWIDPASLAPVEEPVEEVAEVEPEPVEAVRLSDKDALATIARKFRPIGTIQLGGRSFLSLPGGRRMNVGDSFRARVEDFTYTITIESVSSTEYTLRVGEATLAQGFGDRIP